MHITHDNDIARDPAGLTRAWEQRQSLVVLPSKIANEAWLHDRLDNLDEDLRQGHFVLLTSGSSGRPKLVIASKTRAESLARLLHKIQDNEVAQRALIALPLSYSFAFVNQWVWSHVHGRDHVLSPGLKQPLDFARDLEKETPTMLCLVGAQVPLLLRHYAGRQFPSVLRLHFAGGPFPQSKISEIRAMFPRARISNNYGCTEAMPRLTVRWAQTHEDARNVGQPLPGIELKIDETDRVLFRSPFGAIATIDQRGTSRFDTQDWIEVGDLGELQVDGSLVVTGRANSVFKRFGEKISLPTLLQTTQRAWTGRAEFYLDEDPSGEPGHVLVIEDQASTQGHRAILRAMRAGHPRTHWPIRIERLGKFPELPNGKPDLASLKDTKKDEVLWRQRL